MNTNIIKYFTFDNNISVGLRNGDILIFNQIVKHCISTKTDSYCNDDVFCVSNYMKSTLCGSNNNKIQFDL